MANIKSTLEIALERAQAFELSEDDRKKFKLDELDKNVTTLLYRYIDGSVAKEDVKIKLAELEGKDLASPETMLMDKAKQEVRLEKVILDDRNGKILKLIKYIADKDIASVTETLNAFQLAYRSGVNSRIMKMKKQLKKKKGISGSAVIPHIDIDPKWKTERKKLVEKYEELLYNALKQI